STRRTTPVELLAGDVRRSNDRSRWALLGLTAELIGKAAEELRYRPKDAPIHIRDLEQAKWIAAENRRSVYRSFMPAASPVRGQPVPPQMRPGWRPGMIEWWRHAGRVLSVR